MFNQMSLSLEQSKALKIFENSLQTCVHTHLHKLSDITYNLVTEEDMSFFYNGHLTASLLPKKSNWKWNQSRSKCELLSKTGDLRISFYKLNTRRTNPEVINIPHFKVWIFNITNLNENSLSAFFWCERGDGDTPSLNEKLLKELSFLKRFVTKEQAIEFGWTSIPNDNFEYIPSTNSQQSPFHKPFSNSPFF